MNTPRLIQPEEMKTRAYVYGVEKLNGYDAWALFQACALGDLPKVKSLLAKDRRLVNAQHWYQFPLHKAVSAGHTEIDTNARSEEHTSELQSQSNLVCRLLLEKKKI